MKNIFLNKAKVFAGNNGFDGVSFYSFWQDYEVYELLSKDNEGCAVGYPSFVIVSEKKAEMANLDDTLSIMGISAKPKGYSEQL